MSRQTELHSDLTLSLGENQSIRVSINPLQDWNGGGYEPSIIQDGGSVLVFLNEFTGYVRIASADSTLSSDDAKNADSVSTEPSPDKLKSEKASEPCNLTNVEWSRVRNSRRAIMIGIKTA